jgi:hypothetical protein
VWFSGVWNTKYTGKKGASVRRYWSGRRNAAKSPGSQEGRAVWALGGSEAGSLAEVLDISFFLGHSPLLFNL